MKIFLRNWKIEKHNKAIFCIVLSGPVSRSYYNEGGASDINTLKTGKTTCHSVRPHKEDPIYVLKSTGRYLSICE